MSLHYWNYPTEVFCGLNALDELASQCIRLEISNPLLITDPGVRDLPMYGVLTEKLKKANIIFGEYFDIESNPTFENVGRGQRFFIENGHDSIIALGGGSVIDASKGIALGSVCPNIKGFEWQTAMESYPTLTAYPHLDVPPLVVIPTTAGTGSELSREAVLTDSETETKKVITHAELMASAVFLDPNLTSSLPRHITAATGMDALVHHIEALVSPLYHPMSAGIAMEGVRLIHDNLITATEDGNNLQAREGMLVTSAMAAVAFQKGLGGVHALAHPLGARYHHHHGLLNAILLPYVLIANRPAIESEIERLCRYINLDKADFDGFIEWILMLRKRLEIPNSLSDLGIDASDASWVGKQAVADISSSETNPIQFTEEMYSEIYRLATLGDLG